VKISTWIVVVTA